MLEYRRAELVQTPDMAQGSTSIGALGSPGFTSRWFTLQDGSLLLLQDGGHLLYQGGPVQTSGSDAQVSDFYTGGV